MSLLALLLAAAPPVAQPANSPKPKMVCRDSEQQLGSHIRTGRRCKTAEQWEQEDAARDRIPVTLRVTEGQGADPGQPVRNPQ